MEVTTLQALPHTEGTSPLPTWPCYLLRHEVDKGLEWLANAKAAWALADGRPALIAIGAAASISGTHMFRLKGSPATPPGNTAMARLIKLAARAHRVSRETALDQMFWFFDPEQAADVRRLNRYLAASTSAELVAA